MTSTNGSEPVGASGAESSNDPAVLAAEIEKTREDLAETLDAIAEKVSPKRVAGRTKKKVADAVAAAKETVVEQAGVAKDKVVEQAGAAKEKVADATSSATPSVTASVPAPGQGGSARIGEAATDAVTSLPPVTAVSAEHLDLTSPAPTSTVPTAPASYGAPAAVPASAPGPLVRKEYAAGAGLGVLVLLLLRRRRNRRRAVVTVRGRRRR